MFLWKCGLPGGFCRCAFIDIQAELKSDNENALKGSFRVRNHTAGEEMYIETIWVEFTKAFSVDTPVMLEGTYYVGDTEKNNKISILI